ncbi:MAG TPA: response regulator [Actinomycetota bacterium]
MTPIERSRRKVLVVDDHADIRLMCRVNLQLEGYEVIEAADGQEGLDQIRSERPDVVLLDIMMPGIDGWQVLETVKGDPTLAGIPIVVLTARVQRDDEIRGWSAGASEYLPKPFNPATLTQVVNRTVRGEDDGGRRQRALEKLRIL